MKSILSPMLLKDTTKIEFTDNPHKGIIFANIEFNNYITESTIINFHVSLGGEISVIRITNMLFETDTITNKKWNILIPRYNHRDFIRKLNNDVDLKSHKLYDFMCKIFQSYTKLEPNETVVHTISSSNTETSYGKCDCWGSKYKQGYIELLNKL
jgi:hypothetical protein